MKKYVKDNKVTYYAMAKSPEELAALRKYKSSVVPDRKKENSKNNCRAKGDRTWRNLY